MTSRRIGCIFVTLCLVLLVVLVPVPVPISLFFILFLSMAWHRRSPPRFYLLPAAGFSSSGSPRSPPQF